MKLLASLIIAVSLVIGVIGAMTAYLVPLTLDDERLLGLELNAPVGIHPADVDVDPFKPGGRRPLAARGDLITPELLVQLREQEVVRVPVKEFLLGGWVRGGGLPLFLVGTIGLLGGAVMLRRANRALLVLSTAYTTPAGQAAAPGMSPATPEALFEVIRGGVQKLQRDLPALSDHDKRQAIMERFGETQRVHIPAFVAMRPQLVSRLGLGGYAQLMDTFAAAERQLNRAWSAAADEVLDEAMRRVDMTNMLLNEAAAKLR